MTEDRLLTEQEVADILQVKKSWVAEAAREGKLACVQLGRYRRFRREDVDDFIEQCRAGTVRTRLRIA